MQLNHTFTVPATLEETWAAFEDIESVAGCFPGATVTEVAGEDFKGSCKVKLGPIALVYTGTGHFVEKDQAAGRFVVEAKGKDKRGNGTAGALVTATMTDSGGNATEVNVATDLNITGKPAQFGRGVMQDVSDKLLNQFVDCLKTKVGAGPEADAEPASTGPAEPAAADDAARRSDAAAGASTAPSSSASGAGARKAPSSTYSGASTGTTGSAGSSGSSGGRRPGARPGCHRAADPGPHLRQAGGPGPAADRHRLPAGSSRPLTPSRGGRSGVTRVAHVSG